jgi:hypothetical protein
MPCCLLVHSSVPLRVLLEPIMFGTNLLETMAIVPPSGWYADLIA